VVAWSFNPRRDADRLRVVMLVQKVDAADWLLGFTIGWIRALAARVESVDVVTLEQRAADLPANVRVHSLGKERGTSRIQQVLRFEAILSNLARHSDVIFGHLTPRYTWLAAPFAALHGVPQYLWYTHRNIDRDLRLALPCVRWIVTAAPGSFPLSTPKVQVMGHGIDAHYFTPANPDHPDRPTQLDRDPPLILAVGRLAPIKHHHILIDAAAHLRDRGVAAHFAIAGGVASADGAAYRAQLAARIVALNLSDRFHLLDAVRGDDLLVWYRRASVVTNLSPPGLFDKAALEAMLTARPVLVANPAFDPVLGAYRDALRVNTPDAVDAISARLADLLAMSEAERAAIGAALRERTIQAHSLDRLMDRLVALFAS